MIKTKQFYWSTIIYTGRWLFQEEMKKLFDMFKTYGEVYLTPQHYFNPAEEPRSLIEELTDNSQGSSMPDFLKKIDKLSQRSGLHRMRILTVFSLLFLYSDSFYDVSLIVMPFKTPAPKKDNKSTQDNDGWLDENVVQPCQQFLMKCSSSPELYKGLKSFCKGRSKNPAKYYNFETLYYLINLIKKVLACLEKISSLGRYYQQDNPVLTSAYIFTMSIQTIRLYSALKLIILQMLNNPSQYLDISSQRELMKNVLMELLPDINQAMKLIILNKYFSPYDHGIRVVLMTNQNQSSEITKVIHSLIKDQTVISTDRQLYNRSVQEMKMDYSFCKESLFNDSRTGCKSLSESKNNLSVDNRSDGSSINSLRYKHMVTHKKPKMLSQPSIATAPTMKPQVRGRCVSMKQIRYLKDMKVHKMSTLEEMQEQTETDEEVQKDIPCDKLMYTMKKKNHLQTSILGVPMISNQQNSQQAQKLFNTENTPGDVQKEQGLYNFEQYVTTYRKC